MNKNLPIKMLGHLPLCRVLGHLANNLFSNALSTQWFHFSKSNPSKIFQNAIQQQQRLKHSSWKSVRVFYKPDVGNEKKISYDL